MKKYRFLIAFLAILATSLIVLFKPPILKTVKIDNVDVVMNNESDNSSKEDKIAWNAWHCNVGNLILKEKNVPPNEALNTLNVIQFNVDNKRNISNIIITAEPAKYSKLAQKHYFEYVNSLNGNSILEFPKNSERKVVHVKVPIVTSDKVKFNKPQDYSDYETIRK